MIFLKRVLSLLILIMFSTQLYCQKLKHLTLDDCVSLGLQKNFEIQKYNYDFLITDEHVTQAYSQYEPVLTSGLSRSEFAYQGNTLRIDKMSLDLSKKVSRTGGTLSLATYNQLDDSMSLFNPFAPNTTVELSAQYSQPFLSNFAGKNDKMSLEIAGLGKDVSKEMLNFQKNILENNIEKTYYDLIFAEKNLEVQKISLDRSKKLLVINKKKLRDGLLEKVDVISTEAVIQLREATLLLAEDAVMNAKDNLKVVLGITGDEDINFISDDTKYKETFEHNEIKVEDVISQALVKRGDLKLLNISEEITKKNKSIKKNEKLPLLNLSAKLSKLGYGTSLNNAYDESVPVWYVGANLAIFPFSKRTKSLLKETDYNLDKIVMDLESKRANITKECKAVTRYINTQALYVKAAKQALVFQIEKLRLEEIKFNQGRSSIQWILSFQDDLSNAEVEVLKALTDYYKALSDLELIIGK